MNLRQAASLAPLKEVLADAVEAALSGLFRDPFKSSCADLLVERSLRILAPIYLQRIAAMAGSSAQTELNNDDAYDDDRLNGLAMALLKNGVEALSEMAARLDHHHLVPVGIGDSGGDLHNCGRSTLSVLTENGRQFVYRPVPPFACRLFHEVYSLCLSALDPGMQLRQYPEICARTYSITPFLRVENGIEIADHAVHFRSVGVLSAVAFALRASDLHFENLLVHNSVLFPFDVEVLGHTRYDGAEFSLLDTGLVGIQRLSGILGGGNVNEFGVFVGEGNRNAKLSFFRSKWLADNRLVDKDGQPIAPKTYLSEIEAGFVAAARLLENGKSRLKRMIFEHAASCDLYGDSIRILIRPTMLYSNLIAQISQPFLGRADAVKAFLRDRLTTSPTMIWETPPAKVVEAEIEDIMRGEIPLFHARWSERNLLHHTGILYMDALNSTPETAVVESIEGFRLSDLRPQLTQFLSLLSEEEV